MSVLASTAAWLLLLPALVACGQEKPAEAKVTEERFDAKDFTEPTTITNQYFPLSPGTKSVFEGHKKNVPARVEIVVTNETKVVNGVTTVVVDDKVFEAGQLVEEALDWFAQDKRGTVWYFGEYVTDYAKGQITGHKGSWEAGVKGARPGTVMPASPQIGRVYRQEVAKGTAEDVAKVIKVNDSLCVPLRCFQSSVLITEDWSLIDSKEVQHKYYASGVGQIRTLTVKGDPEQLDLVSVQRVG
jgi:hypothetical protein